VPDDRAPFPSGPPESPMGGAPPSRRRRWHWSLDLALAVAVFIGLQAWLTRDVVRGALPALAAPLVNASTETAQDWRLAHGGDGFVLYVWAGWCAICKTIEGSVDAVASSAPVLTVAMQSGTPAEVASTLQRRGLRWPALVDPTGALSRSLGVDAVPTLIFVDRRGTVRSVTQGYTSEFGIRARLWWTRRFDSCGTGMTTC
jgi:thiol-disulfide isomerase/thioredoxin